MTHILNFGVMEDAFWGNPDVLILESLHLSMVDLPTFIAFTAWMLVWILWGTNSAASSLKIYLDRFWNN